jgi:DNA-binding winged helix-turn-helix (wHTH) protein
VTVRFGDFVLDSDARRLLRASTEVRLTPKAFDLLCTLVARRPHVLAKGDLMARIWPDTFVVDANLNVLVGELRRALGDDPHAPRYIRTAHGIGYAFCADAAELDTTAAARAASRWWLAAKGLTFPLIPGENIIGRDPRSDIWLDNDGVSRRHARIRIEPATGAVLLEDLASTNGTFLGGERLDAGAVLHDGDVFEVGSVQLKFRVWSDTDMPTRRIRGRTSARG